MKTTLDLNTIIKITDNNLLFDFFNKLKKEKIFSKLFPGPKTLFEKELLVIAINNEDLDKVEPLLRREKLEYNSILLKNDIIDELLKR